ncbi:hypothetical protein [Actinocatenispora rupis]|nr:hypothetical protein [Actinocatenispora rupis]
MTPLALTILRELAQRSHTGAMDGWITAYDMETVVGCTSAAETLRAFVACGWATRRGRSLCVAPTEEFRATTAGLAEADTTFGREDRPNP